MTYDPINKSIKLTKTLVVHSRAAEYDRDVITEVRLKDAKRNYPPNVKQQGAATAAWRDPKKWAIGRLAKRRALLVAEIDELKAKIASHNDELKDIVKHLSDLGES